MRPPEKPSIKCCSIKPSVMCRSAAMNRSSIYTGVPSLVVPSAPMRSQSRAHRGSPRGTPPRSPSHNRIDLLLRRRPVKPVAIRIVTPSTAIPPACSRSSSGGSVTRFGAGRVMSQTEIAAVRLPAASPASGSQPIGRSSAACQRGPHRQAPRRGLHHLAIETIGNGNFNAVFAKGKTRFHDFLRTETRVNYLCRLF